MNSALSPDEDETIVFIEGVFSHIGPKEKPSACHLSRVLVEKWGNGMSYFSFTLRDGLLPLAAEKCL